MKIILSLAWLGLGGYFTYYDFTHHHLVPGMITGILYAAGTWAVFWMPRHPRKKKK